MSENLFHLLNAETFEVRTEGELTAINMSVQTASLLSSPLSNYSDIVPDGMARVKRTCAVRVSVPTASHTVSAAH